MKATPHIPDTGNSAVPTLSVAAAEPSALGVKAIRNTNEPFGPITALANGTSISANELLPESRIDGTTPEASPTLVTRNPRLAVDPKPVSANCMP